MTAWVAHRRRILDGRELGRLRKHAAEKGEKGITGRAEWKECRQQGGY